MPAPARIDSGTMDASIAVLKQSAAPLTVADIAASLGKKKNSKFNTRLSQQLTHGSADYGIYEWPKHGNSRIYSARPLRECVEAALLNALGEQPLTVAKAARPVSRQLRRVSEKTALKEIASLTPGLASANRVMAFALNRQSVIYFSFDWLGRLISAPAPESRPVDAMSEAILEGVRQLQSGIGNYVRIDQLRNAPVVRRILDKAAIGLADAGKLVLARYDGPRPVPDAAKANYVEDESGELFIGIALPRPEAAGA